MESVCFFLPIKAVDNFSLKKVYTNHSRRKMAFLRQTLGDDSASSFRCFCLCQSAQMVLVQVKTAAYQGNLQNYLVYAPSTGEALRFSRIGCPLPVLSVGKEILCRLDKSAALLRLLGNSLHGMDRHGTFCPWFPFRTWGTSCIFPYFSHFIESIYRIIYFNNSFHIHW